MTEESTTENGNQKKRSPLLRVALLLVLPVAGLAAGVFLTPLLLPSQAQADSDEALEKDLPEKEEPPIVVNWPALVVDIPDQHGSARHVKLVLSLETNDGQTEKELQAFSPRARQAILGYLRSQKYEELMVGGNLDALQVKLQSIAAQRLGPQRLKHLWITDLVAQ
ncbi:MAG: flagellar basal body-associated FliL family protein [Polyangiaceae bacterium]|nr:flagellar basal body-associated FliL family protein [Polyangiaceae bacterium]